MCSEGLWRAIYWPLKMMKCRGILSETSKVIGCDKQHESVGQMDEADGDLQPTGYNHTMTQNRFDTVVMKCSLGIVTTVSELTVFPSCFQHKTM